MRRLLLILIACMALVPLVPAAGHASRQHSAACASCPAPIHPDTGCADHGCLGCSIAPEAMPEVAPSVAERAASPIPTALTMPTPHRPDFEPPPPRIAG